MLLALLLVLTQAQVFAWKDKAGVEHFTNDLKAIPQGVKVRTTEGEEISRIEPGPKPQPIAVQPTAVVAPTSADPSVPSPSEEVWRRLFREARTRVIVLEEDIEADRKKVEEVNGMPLSTRFLCQGGWWAPPSAGLTVSGQLVPGLTVNGMVTTAPQPYLTSCGYNFNPEYERVRERLEKNRREVVRAREELADLDRRASFEAVPQHWRR